VEYIQQLKYHAVPLLYSTLYFYGGLSVAIASGQYAFAPDAVSRSLQENMQ
jgi:hypothetical protein